MNTKQKVLLGLAGLTALAVAGGSVGTMAWFYSNTTVTASGLSMSVKGVSDNIQISLASSSGFGSSVSLADSTVAQLTPCLMLANATNKSLTNKVVTAGTGMIYNASGEWTDYGCPFWCVPGSNNPVLSNGSLSTDFDWSKRASYFSSLSSTTGYVIHKTVYYKVLPGHSNSYNYNLKAKPTFTGTSDILKSMLFFVTAKASSATYVYGGIEFDKGSSNSELAFNSACGGADQQRGYVRNVTGNATGQIDIYGWIDGSSSYCTNAYLSSAGSNTTIGVSFGFSVDFPS